MQVSGRNHRQCSAIMNLLPGEKLTELKMVLIEHRDMRSLLHVVAASYLNIIADTFSGRVWDSSYHAYHATIVRQG